MRKTFQPHAVDVHVGKRLRLRREQQKMSQTTLAAAIGRTFQQIQKYESATNRISAGVLYDMAMALSTPVGWFFEGLAEAGRADPDPFGEKDSIDLVRHYASISDPAVRESVHKMLRTLADGQAAKT